MQLAGDATLAQVLGTGQKRRFATILMVDWARDNTFGDPLANLSAYVEEWSLERSLAGVVPDQLQTTEGYATAKLTIKLSGETPAGIPMWKLFSPFSGLSYSDGSALNVPMVLRVAVQSPLGYWEIDQITGWIDSAIPDLASGTVTMVCFDGGGQLETGITVDRWAVDQFRREVYQGDTASLSDEASESGTIEAGWLIDTALRRTGFYEGPTWHNNAIHSRTLRGSALPELGTWAQIPIADFDNLSWSSGMFFSTPHLGPAMQTTGEVWSKAAGKYGPAYLGRYRLSNWKATGTRGLPLISSGTKATIQMIVTTYGGNNSNILGWSGWVYIDSTLSSDPWSTDVITLSAKDGAVNPPQASITVKHKTNSVAFTVSNDGGSVSWNWSGAVGANGWHFVSITFQFTPTQVWGSMWVDSVNVVNATNGGHVGGLAASSRVFVEGSTNSVFLSLAGPMQYTQWIYSFNTLPAGYVQPLGIQPITARLQAKVDLAGQRLLHFPDIEQTPAGDVIKAVVGAELGAFYFTEQGVATFDSRATVKSRQLSANSVFDVTIDNASNLQPVSALLSIANRIGYTAKPRVSQPYQHAYAASKPDQFVIQPGAHPRFTVTLSDVQSYRCGGVTVRPFAQGHDSGLSPDTLFWQEYMQHYGPNYWEEGTTPYQPGSQPSNGPPPLLFNAYIFALPGWFNIDLSNRHMRLAAGNDNASTVAQFSVNDSVAFMIVGGSILVDRPAVTESITDATSIARYRERVFNLSADDWHQDILWLRSLGASLLADTKNPTVQFQDIDVVGDPRRQLQDVCRIVHKDGTDGSPGMTGASQAYGSVVGIKRKLTRDGQLTDTLTIRTFAA